MEPDSSTTQMMSATGSAVIVPTSHSSVTTSPAVASEVPSERSLTMKPVWRLTSW